MINYRDSDGRATTREAWRAYHKESVRRLNRMDGSWQSPRDRASIRSVRARVIGELIIDTLEQA